MTLMSYDVDILWNCCLYGVDVLWRWYFM